MLSLWEWFQALADRVTGDRTWSVGHEFVLYGVDPPECSVGVLRRLHFCFSYFEKTHLEKRV